MLIRYEYENGLRSNIKLPTEISYQMKIVTIAQSLRIYKIFANTIICKQFDLENASQCQEEKPDLYHLTENV